MRAATVAAVSAVLSEPAAALAHRLVMHRPRGWRWHRSHHLPLHTRWEDNDRFPLLFAGLTIMTMTYRERLAVATGCLAPGPAWRSTGRCTSWCTTWPCTVG